MKSKCILLLLLICMVSMQTKAQFQLGAEVGTNLSSVAVASNHLRSGLGGGISANYTFQKQVVLQTGLYYVTKGANNLNNTLNSGPFIQRLDVRLGYIELPVMVGYRIPLVEHISIVPLVGMYVAYGVNGNGEYKSYTIKSNYSASSTWDNPFTSTGNGADRLQAFKRFDYGLRFRVNADIYNFTLALSYDLGLQKNWVGFDDTMIAVSKNILKNRSAMISIGYNFSL